MGYNIIEPERPIIDAHHHLWAAQGQTKAYLLEDMRRDVEGGHNIKATVFVEVHADYYDTRADKGQLTQETAFANAVAEEAIRHDLKTRFCAGIIANIDLNFDNLPEIVDAQIQAAPDRLRGVRQLAAWFPERTHLFKDNPEYYNMPSFRRGFALLAPRGLSFDACVFHFQIPQVIALARAFPETTIILDHLGSPLGIGPYVGRVEEVFAIWKRLIREAACCTNIIMKLGGQGMETAGHEWPPERADDEARIVTVIEKYFRHAIDHFGPDRCMFESNFPMDAPATSYSALWNAFKIIAEPYPEEDKHAMFYETANRVYRLNCP